MIRSRNADFVRALRAGAFAGLAGAILLDGYRLFLAYISAGALPEDHYRYVASALLGSAAYALPGAAYLGVLIHVALAVSWACGFAWIALHSSDVATKPIVSGAFFGVVVYVVTRLMTFAAGIAQPDTPRAAFVELVAHTVFFGVPVALIVTARLRSA